jgi:peptidoglycan/xylan/chitin deacetylase (PgdA/CDA1 family)
LLDCVAIDKKKIDKELSQDTTIFAYPYGRWDEVAVDAVSKAGYKYAFTSDSGYLEDSISELKLLRTNVGMRDFLVARAYIEGCSEILTSDMAKLRSLARVF